MLKTIKPKITKDMLEKGKDWDILAKWIFVDKWNTNITGTKNYVNWVAVRWYIVDWAIYYSFFFSDDKMIAKHWDKIPKSMIKNIVDIDDFVFDKYRI